MLDRSGLFVTREGDGGDSLANEGSFEFAQFLTQRLGIEREPFPGKSSWRLAAKMLEADPGAWVRHPDALKWYSNPKTTSRDQLINALLALGVNKQYRELGRLCWSIAKRGFTAPNTLSNWELKKKPIGDLFWLHLPLLIRPWGVWAAWLYPLLFVLDLINLLLMPLKAMPYRFADGLKLRRKTMDDVDVRNSVNAHLAAAFWMPTPFSWASRWVYCKLIHKNYGNLSMGEPNKVQGALSWYFRFDNPEIAEAYRPLIKKFFKAAELK